MRDAILLFNKSIEQVDNAPEVWYNRGIANMMLKNYEEAVIDFSETITLSPDCKKCYLNRGTAQKLLTKYTEAINDYNQALLLDKMYADAYYNRGLIHQLYSRQDSACLDFKRAFSFGLESAKQKVKACNDTTQNTIPIYPILKLSKRSTDPSYGFTETNPVKVGNGPNGGASNQHVYLNLLRDGLGKPITYNRIGSCCAYKSENGFMGMALLDKYEIIGYNLQGKKTTSIIYITFYDYEEPLILDGFKTVGE